MVLSECAMDVGVGVGACVDVGGLHILRYGSTLQTWTRDPEDSCVLVKEQGVVLLWRGHVNASSQSASI